MKLQIYSKISFKSENLVFKEVIKILKLDKYYSKTKKINFITSKKKEVTVHMILKKKTTIKCSNECKTILIEFVNNIQNYFS